jgi:hypothetical protein
MLAINLKYNPIEIDKNEAAQLKDAFLRLVTEKERVQGLGLKFKGLLFIIESTVIDLNTNEKMITISQVTTNQRVKLVN